MGGVFGVYMRSNHASICGKVIEISICGLESTIEALVNGQGRGYHVLQKGDDFFKKEERHCIALQGAEKFEPKGISVNMTTFTRISEEETPSINVDVTRRLSKIGESRLTKDGIAR